MGDTVASGAENGIGEESSISSWNIYIYFMNPLLHPVIGKTKDSCSPLKGNLSWVLVSSNPV